MNHAGDIVDLGVAVEMIELHYPWIVLVPAVCAGCVFDPVDDLVQLKAAAATPCLPTGSRIGVSSLSVVFEPLLAVLTNAGLAGVLSGTVCLVAEGVLFGRSLFMTLPASLHVL
jgi:hypothetical protein